MISWNHFFPVGIYLLLSSYLSVMGKLKAFLYLFNTVTPISFLLMVLFLRKSTNAFEKILI